jgi:hypothetical protein
MTQRAWIFAPTAVAAATVERPGTIVVLDSSWTPTSADDPRLLPIRPAFAAALEAHDLFAESLAVLDAWASACGMPDRLVVDGIAYWYRARETLWNWTHERLLWLRALEHLGLGASDSLLVPLEEGALIDVATALGQRVEIVSPPPVPLPPPPPKPKWQYGRILTRQFIRAIRRLPSQLSREAQRSDQTVTDRRNALLQRRLDWIAGLGPKRVLVVTMPSLYQQIGPSGTGPTRDPNLASVIPALLATGLEPIVFGWGMTRAVDTDWQLIEGWDRLLPAFIARERYSRPSDVKVTRAAVEATIARLAEEVAVPFLVGGADLSKPLARFLEAWCRSVLQSELDERVRVERLVADLKPKAIVTTHEGHRVAWLVAGARAGIPTFAIQHGVLYAEHPGYPDQPDRRVVLPTRTFVFGPFERRVLEGWGYPPDQIEVTGAPRLELDTVPPDEDSAGSERQAVRRELGVSPDDQLVVVSTAHVPYLRRAYIVRMIETALGGALPGVHIVFKQHPGERDPGPYRALLEGLAAAGGYQAPATSVVRQIDLFRVLRAADAHIGQYSTVLTEAVLAGTRNLLVRSPASRELLGYVEAGVAQPVESVDDVKAALAAPNPTDQKARQAFLDDHFRPGMAGARIADAVAFVVDPTRHAR